VSDADELERFLADSCERIDAYFERNLPPASEPPQLLHEAMRYAVYSGGKRLRPALVFAAAHACELAPERAAPLAAAVELVHTYSSCTTTCRRWTTTTCAAAGPPCT